MQLSQALSSAITQISFKQPNYKSHKKDLAPALSSFFQFLHNLKINFLYIVLMQEGFSAFFFFFFFFFFCLWQLLLLKKDFQGLIDVFPLQGGSGGPPPENFGKSRMLEKPSILFLRLILYIFIFH